MHRLLVALLLSAAPVTALAQEPAPQTPCAAADDSRLPPALSAWTRRTPIAAAGAMMDLSQASLPIGKGVDAQLKHTGEVVFPVSPGKPGGAMSHGGLYDLRIAEAGDYQVSLGAGAWIELVSGEVLVESTAHAHGAACSSLKKTVVFRLKPGRYVLEITGAPEPTLPVMVTRLAR